MIADMLMKFRIIRKFDRTTLACKDRQTDFFLLLRNAGLFDFLIGLLLFLEHTCLLVSLSLLLTSQISLVESNSFNFLTLVDQTSLLDFLTLFD